CHPFPKVTSSSHARRRRPALQIGSCVLRQARFRAPARDAEVLFCATRSIRHLDGHAEKESPHPERARVSVEGRTTDMQRAARVPQSILRASTSRLPTWLAALTTPSDSMRSMMRAARL